MGNHGRKCSYAVKVLQRVDGVSYNREVDLANHLSIYKTRRGLNEVARGMINIQMEEIQSP